ncbi:MAG: hypothetical protein R3336_04100 [Phycisphaeraceae bacterium]|nr:hypothetical protein [Phycisphaeraceae bacterium]
MTAVASWVWTGERGPAPRWEKALVETVVGDESDGTVVAVMPGAMLWPGGIVAEAQGDGRIAAVEVWLADQPVQRIERSGEELSQVYRQLDNRGRFVKDVIRDRSDDPISGIPLLLKISEKGLGDPDRTAAQHAAAAPSGGDYPVVDERSAPGTAG